MTHNQPNTGKLLALLFCWLTAQASAQPHVSIAHTTITLLNLYPVSANQCCMTLSFSEDHRLTKIISCITEKQGDHYTFTSPLHYLTRHWKTTQVGHINYHYPDNINLTCARAFEKHNIIIATKLALTPENFDFYLTDNYQEIPPLLGYIYDPARIGRTRDGSFDGDHQIFAIQHNEDFSHDLIHYYISKSRTTPRNGAAEEGLAYYWGNAYYTDSNRNMIDYPTQLIALRNYAQEHPDTSLLSLFDHNAKPFPNLAPEVSARSILSARLFQLLEDTQGIQGVMALINCGRGDDNYFKTLDNLTGINRTNFDIRLRTLLTR